MSESGPRSMQDVKDELGPKLCELLIFKKSDNLITVKPREYLGTQTFAKVAERLRAVGGSYSTSDRLFNVHLRVAKRKPPRRAPAPARRRVLQQIVEDLQRIQDELRGITTEIQVWMEE